MIKIPQMVCDSSSVNIIYIIIPSEFQNNCSNIHSRSQNRCFKNFLIFGEKTCATKCPKKCKIGDPIAVLAMPN